MKFKDKLESFRSFLILLIFCIIGVKVVDSIISQYNQGHKIEVEAQLIFEFEKPGVYDIIKNGEFKCSIVVSGNDFEVIR